jgi:nucleotide-binding universal stress UspA family protein
MRILVAVDGSDESFHALRALEHLARAEKLIVLNALDVPRLAYPMGGEPRVMEDFSLSIQQAMQEDSERLLERVASLLPMNVGPLSKQIERGTPAEAILAAAEKEKAGLIVLGSRGLGPVKELLLGSVSHRVVSHAACPTLVVNRPMRSLRRILMAVQGSEDAEALTKFLAAKPFKEPVEITVVTVLPAAQPLFPPGFAKIDELIEKAVVGARAFVEETASALSKLQYHAKGYILMGAPALAILQEASASDPDLILMGSHGRRGVTRFLLGSVSHAVLHRAPCPLLIVR